MYCTHCGEPIADGSDHCPRCGAAHEPAPAQAMPRYQQESQFQQPYERQSQPQFQRQPPSPQARRQPQATQFAPQPASQPWQPQDGYQPQPPRQPPYQQSYAQPAPQPVPAPPREPWINRNDGVGAICRHFHAQDHGRWKAIGMGGAIVCVATLLLPWYTFAFFGADVLDFLNIFGDGIRSVDWPIIAIASAAVIATLYLGHPMWALGGCAFLCYFAISNLMSTLMTLNFMHPTLWLLLYMVAAVTTTYATLSAGALEELNQALPATNSPYRQQ